MASTAALKATTLGKQAKTDLPEAVFGEPFHETLVHEAARADLAARRRGTASSLGRGEVSMTGAEGLAAEGHRPRPRRRAQRPAPPRRRRRVRPEAAQRTPSRSTARRAAGRCARRSRVHAARDSIAVARRRRLRRARRPSRPPRRSPSGAPSGPTLVLVDRRGDRRSLKSFRNIPRVDVLPVELGRASPTSIGHALADRHRGARSRRSRPRVGEVDAASARGEAEEAAS